VEDDTFLPGLLRSYRRAPPHLSLSSVSTNGGADRLQGDSGDRSESSSVEQGPGGRDVTAKDNGSVGHGNGSPFGGAGGASGIDRR